jgi:hypothetical protein
MSGKASPTYDCPLWERGRLARFVGFFAGGTPSSYVVFIASGDN